MITWGSSSTQRRALLIHSPGGSAAVWHKVARGLVDAGFKVDAPDLAGCGFAPRIAQYTIKQLALDLAQRIDLSCVYDTVVGASFGANILVELVPLFAVVPRRIVLCDPVLDIDLSLYPPDKVEKLAHARDTTPSEHDLLVGNPHWEPEDAVIKRLSALQTDPQVVFGVWKDARSGVCTHQALAAVAELQCEVVIAAADPQAGGIYQRHHEESIPKRFPAIKICRGIGVKHDMHRDNHEFAVDVILGRLVDEDKAIAQ